MYVTEGMQQYVIGLRLAVKDGQISEIESIVTTGTVSGSAITSNDWNFDAQAYLACAKSEDWSVVPEAQRNTREELIAAGEAYLKIFSDKATVVPGAPLLPLEGGKGCTPAADKASQSCNVGVPSGINFKNTHWVVDLELNTAVGLTLFAGASPDSYMFRLISGKIVRRSHLDASAPVGVPRSIRGLSRRAAARRPASSVRPEYALLARRTRGRNERRIRRSPGRVAAARGRRVVRVLLAEHERAASALRRGRPTRTL